MSNRSRRSKIAAVALASAAAAAVTLDLPRLARAQFTTSTVDANGYAAGDINSCAIQVNNLTTVGTHQFIAYYDSSRNVTIARRDVGSSAWQTYSTGYSISASDITDDHNVIALAIDGSGLAHLSWDMHNQALNYAISNAPVTGTTLTGSSIAFTTQTAANAPTLFPSAGATTNSVTYPQFYNIPNSNDLLFTYRNGGAGGGSGNGNQFFNVYSAATNSWTNNFVIDGESSSVNAYLNSLALTSTNNWLMSWTWRATPNWQTNSNIMFAQSPDNGTSWYQQGGTTQYALPITQASAQVVKNIPQGSSFINQTSMTVDGSDRPYIATYFAPNWNVSTNTGDPNRQYMLVYYDGAQWRTSQVSNRTSDTSIDSGGSDVRDLGRPIVLTDNAGRVLLVTRSEDTSMGAYSNPATVGNGYVVYWNTVASLDSATPDPWQKITLDTTNLGGLEPTYDPALWKAQNKLSLFYQPIGLGASSSTIEVLDWDEVAYFNNPPTINYWNIPGGGNWDTASNWAVGVPNAASAEAHFGGGAVAPAGDTTITVTGTRTLGVISFDTAAFHFSLVPGAGGTLALNNGTSTATITSNLGSHLIATGLSLVSNASVSVAGGGTLTFGGVVSGSGALTKAGAGTLVLSSNNTYSGQTTLNGGTLRALGSGALSPNSNVAISSGLLESNGSLTRVLGTTAGRIRITGGASGFAATGGDFIVNITNGGSPISWGTTTFAPSTLLFNNSGATSNVDFTSALSLNGAARTVQVNAAQATLSGAITSNTGSLHVEGAGTLILANTANTYGGGTSINFTGQGPATVRAATSNALGTGAIDIAPQGNSSTGRLEMTGGISLPNAVTFHGRTSSSVAIENVAGNNTLGGVITLNTGGGNYWIQSDAGTLTLANTLTSTATGARNVTVQGAADGVISGNIVNGSATMNLIKSGSGTWTFSGSANTYSGSTTVNAGKLILASSLINSSAMSIAAGATTELAAGSSAELKTPSLTVNGRLDVKDNKVIVSGGDVNAITGLIAAGRNGGGWNGSAGIVTSMSAATSSSYTSVGVARGSEVNAATVSQTALWGGQTITGSDVLVMYTYGGDATLDGKINIDDYIRIDNGIASQLAGWSNGDFNYDGKVNIDDYTQFIDANIGTQGAPFQTSSGGPASAGPVSAIPEPACAFALALGWLTFRASIRRRRAFRIFS